MRTEKKITSYLNFICVDFVNTPKAKTGKIISIVEKKAQASGRIHSIPVAMRYLLEIERKHRILYYSIVGIFHFQ